MKRWFPVLGQAALLLLTWAVVFEVGFRLQQYFGPLYDLELANINLNWKSDVLNHQPTPENQNMCIYGDTTGFSYKRSFDANGIRILDDTTKLADCRNPTSVLFLGDSFIEGYDDKNTLPYHVQDYFKRRGVCLKTYNAGYTSYSPAIFVPQAKKLLPIVRPDYIVVDVDETDLYDDFARYRKLIVRNDHGKNIGVKASPIGHECSVGLIEARNHRLYVMRFVATLWHSYVHMPSVIEKYREPNLTLFSYSQDHGTDLEQKYSDALFAFRKNLQELADVLKEYTKDGSRVLFIFHPHLQHLKPDTAGRVWNNLVSSSVQTICVANSFLFFNATDPLRQRFGLHPENFYWKVGDMHFDFKGLAEYSAAVAGFMASDMIDPKGPPRTLGQDKAPSHH